MFDINLAEVFFLSLHFVGAAIMAALYLRRRSVKRLVFLLLCFFVPMLGILVGALEMNRVLRGRKVP